MSKETDARRNLAGLLNDLGNDLTMQMVKQERDWHEVVLFCQKIKKELEVKKK